MRILWITIPACLALLSGGGLLLLAANRPHVENVNINPGEVRHKVTPDMTQATTSVAKTKAPDFFVKDTEGGDVMIAPPTGTRPQFVYFVQHGCPCSYDAEPLFHKLYQRYKGKVDFISVTDANLEKAREWSVQMLVPYSLVPDPEKTIIHAFKARSSVYSALVSQDGHILKMWPGYSRAILQEQNALMAKLSNVAVQKFETDWAPEEKATGCAF